MPIIVSRRAQRARSSQIRELLHLTRRPDVLSMAGGLPAPDTFPRAALADALAAALALDGPTGPPALQYGPTEGDPTLREYLAALHGVAVDQVLVTTGSQQALGLLAEVLADPGEAVAVADPTYLGAIQAFDRAGVDLVPLASDDEGVLPNDLRAGTVAHGRCSLVYLVPDFANPTGAVTSLDRRHALAAVADRRGLTIVEDRPYHELRFHGAPLPAIGELTDRAVRVGTVSKVLAPGLRVGWMVGPAEVIGAATRVKQALDLHTSSLDQLAALQLLADPAFLAPHLGAVRRHYATRATALCDALDAHLGERFVFDRPAGGMFVWGRFVDDIDSRVLLHHALDLGVAFVPGVEFAAGELTRWRAHARLSFSTLSCESFDEAVSRLAEALDRVSTRSSQNLAAASASQRQREPNAS